jgi:hypothetical protein
MRRVLNRTQATVIDNFSILLSHALLAFALWHLMSRADLDSEDPPRPEEGPVGFAVRAHTDAAQADNTNDA